MSDSWSSLFGDAEADLARGVDLHVCAARLLRGLVADVELSDDEVVTDVLVELYKFYKRHGWELLVQDETVVALARDVTWMAEDDVADQLGRLVTPYEDVER